VTIAYASVREITRSMSNRPVPQHGHRDTQGEREHPGDEEGAADGRRAGYGAEARQGVDRGACYERRDPGGQPLQLLAALP
jgi:hypothetical protein